MRLSEALAFDFPLNCCRWLLGFGYFDHFRNSIPDQNHKTLGSNAQIPMNAPYWPNDKNEACSSTNKNTTDSLRTTFWNPFLSLEKKTDKILQNILDNGIKTYWQRDRKINQAFFSRKPQGKKMAS